MKKLIALFIFSCAAAALAFAGGQKEPAPQPSGQAPQAVDEDPPNPRPERPADVPVFDPVVDRSRLNWWNDAVFYEIYTRSFRDSDGDGVGDLKGLISRLDYLNDGDPATSEDLGITGIWLMPIFQAKNAHGYDTIDYYTVAKEYGTNEDLANLIKECHKRGIKIIVDLVLNHTSNENPWFLDASSGPDSPYRDFYVWSSSPLSKKGPWGQEPVWHPQPSTASGNFYYGVFNFAMPDLNLAHPKVTQEMYKVADHWLKAGLDGYRLDAIRYFVEDGRKMSDAASTHAWLRDFNKHYKSVNSQAFTVGEAMENKTDVVLSYTGDQVDVAFHFPLARATWEAPLKGVKEQLEDILTSTVDSFPAHQWANFLTNHDQTRVMSELGARWDLARQAATLLLTMPGVPFLYYGEEIGQQGKRPSDENARRPLQWASTPPGYGFTEGKPYGAGFNQPGKENTIADQQKEPGSLWSLYRDLIALRSAHPALRTGRFIPIETDRSQIFAFLRYDEAETFLVLFNLGRKDYKEYGLTLWSGPFKPGAKVQFAAGDPLKEGELRDPEINASGGFDFYMPVGEGLRAKSSYVLKLGGS